MKIAGLEKTSLVDYPGKIAAVIFTPGCNLDCYYCHNRILLGDKGYTNLISQEEVLRFLEKRAGLLEGVVISGGEPCIQPGLEEFIGKVRSLGYSVKLDTNGSKSKVLQELLEKKLLDYVAMDIKAPFTKYEDICGAVKDLDSILEGIRESIKILLTGRIEYEFRTTFIPELTEDDIMEIAGMIKGARLYALQQYRVPETIDGDISSGAGKGPVKDFENPHSPAFILEVAGKIDGRVNRCITRGF
jgi:pyruvate formate lyase activating enzyme